MKVCAEDEVSEASAEKANASHGALLRRRTDFSAIDSILLDIEGECDYKENFLEGRVSNVPHAMLRIDLCSRSEDEAVAE